MEIFDEDNNLVESTDLNIGHIVMKERIKNSATPLGENKECWLDDDYETVGIYIKYTKEEIDQISHTNNVTDFVNSAPTQINDLTITIAEIIGA